jgi:CRISPR-associated protein Csd1
MIIQSLTAYYDRLKENSDQEIPDFGFGNQKIYFALVLDEKGTLLRVLDLRHQDKTKFFPKILTVPQELEERSGSKVAAHFMWDNSMYVLGADKKGNKKRSSDAFDNFKSVQQNLCEGCEDRGMKAVLAFLNSWSPENAESLEYWEDIAGNNLVFKLDDDMEYVHERPQVRKAWIKYLNEKEKEVEGECLVTGGKVAIARLHPAIKGVRGAQQKGASIVSFNLDAFVSYNKAQSYNAPVGEELTFKYTTALNRLLSIDSRQKIQIGDATTVFWTERDSPVEGFLGMVFNPGEDSSDIKEVHDFLDAVVKGKIPMTLKEPDMRFFILGLSPNASRLSVRFWHVDTVENISLKIGKHFNDLSIVRQYEKDPAHPGMWQLLKETAVLRDTKNISPLLAGAFMRSILTGGRYPQSLLTALISRIRADQRINYLRAAIIKAFLIRKNKDDKNFMEVGMALNTETVNTAYRLGRLFAVLEKAQQDAIPGANTTIKDRFYGSASSTPRTVFPQLLRLAQHHIQKAKYGRKTDKTIEDIMQKINEFPAHLTLDDQGLFALGYYHQRQALYTKSENKENEND